MWADGDPRHTPFPTPSTTGDALFPTPPTLHDATVLPVEALTQVEGKLTSRPGQDSDTQ